MESVVKYTIAGRYMDGTKVKGYYLIDQYGNGTSLDKERVEEMALNKQITNCVAQRYKDGIVMKGINNTKLSQLPVVDVSKTKELRAEVKDSNARIGVFAIIGRIVDKKFIRGYILRDSNNSRYKIDRQKVIELAMSGKISNARVQMNNGEPVLRGVGCELSSLPSFRITTNK